MENNNKKIFSNIKLNFVIATFRVTPRPELEPSMKGYLKSAITNNDGVLLSDIEFFGNYYKFSVSIPVDKSAQQFILKVKSESAATFDAQVRQNEAFKRNPPKPNYPQIWLKPFIVSTDDITEKDIKTFLIANSRKSQRLKKPVKLLN